MFCRSFLLSNMYVRVLASLLTHACYTLTTARNALLLLCNCYSRLLSALAPRSNIQGSETLLLALPSAPLRESPPYTPTCIHLPCTPPCTPQAPPSRCTQGVRRSCALSTSWSQATTRCPTSATTNHAIPKRDVAAAPSPHISTAQRRWLPLTGVHMNTLR